MARKSTTEEKEVERKRERKRRHSHHGSHSKREEESDSESSDQDINSGSSDSDSESSSTSEEERERRRQRRLKKKKKKEKETKKRRRSSEGSSKDRSKSKKGHTKSKKKKKTTKIDDISMEYYFRKSVEFRSWLSEERKIFFSDLKSDESRDLFAEFVKEWNSQQLNKKYYKGIQSASLEHGKQTGHVWKFSRSVSQDQLSGLKESVSSWTAGDDVAELGDEERGGASSVGPHPPVGPSTSGVVKGPMIGPSLPGSSVAMATQSDPHLAEERWRNDRERDRRGRKEMRKQHELVMDELLPKATGKEARFEKKKIRAEKRRDREISPDVADSTLMGPKINIQDKIQRRQVQRHNRAQAAADKVAEIQAKEKSKMQALLAMAKATKKEGALW